MLWTYRTVRGERPPPEDPRVLQRDHADPGDDVRVHEATVAVQRDGPHRRGDRVQPLGEKAAERLTTVGDVRRGPEALSLFGHPRPRRRLGRERLPAGPPFTLGVPSELEDRHPPVPTLPHPAAHCFLPSCFLSQARNFGPGLPPGLPLFPGRVSQPRSRQMRTRSRRMSIVSPATPWASYSSSIATRGSRGRRPDASR